MFFKKKHQQPPASAPKSTNAASVHRTEAQREKSIRDIESALSKPKSTEHKSALLFAAGYAYEAGEFGAAKDIEKAKSYYREAENLGSIEAKCARGKLLMMSDDDLCAPLGVAMVCECYRNGYVPAAEIMQTLLDLNVFPDCQTIEEIVKLTEITL